MEDKKRRTPTIEELLNPETFAAFCAESRAIDEAKAEKSRKISESISNNKEFLKRIDEAMRNHSDEYEAKLQKAMEEASERRKAKGWRYRKPRE
tara:strand:+ start:74 stop:355 length:282 start_codon:yes stop_codon:yes gene_type:complete